MDRSWGRRLRAVGDAFLGVVRAEMAAVAADLGSSGRALVRALVWVGAAFAVAFWSLGLLLYLLVELVAIRLPRWQAVGVVLALFVVLTLALALLARSRLRRLESPGAVLGRRFEEHRSWWRESVAMASEEETIEEEEEEP